MSKVSKELLEGTGCLKRLVFWSLLHLILCRQFFEGATFIVLRQSFLYQCQKFGDIFGEKTSIFPNPKSPRC